MWYKKQLHILVLYINYTYNTFTLCVQFRHLFSPHPPEYESIIICLIIMLEIGKHFVLTGNLLYICIYMWM